MNSPGPIPFGAGPADAGAEAALRAAVGRDPASADLRRRLAAALAGQGRHAEAAGELAEAVRLRPADVDAHNNLGVALEKSGRPAEAEAAYRRALELAPAYAEVRNNLANALRKLGRIDEAAAEHREAVRLKSSYAPAWNNLSATLLEQADADAALECDRKVADLLPAGAAAAAGSAYLYNLHYAVGYDAAAVYAEHLRWAERHADPVEDLPAEPHDKDPDPGRRLRVGYLSADLREHPVARFLEPALAHHDRSAFEIYCYSDVARPDAVTARLRTLADVWRETARLGDEQLAEQVRRDRIDVLVDETGHAAGNRLLAFARRPAPVLVTCNGYVNTTGMRSMGWRITDALHDPPGRTDRYHSEQLCRLPECNWCYRMEEDAPQVTSLPALGSGVVTFGCLNKLAKLTPPVLRLWAQVLKAVPGSRLAVAMAGTPQTNRRVPERFERHGLPLDRVEFLPKTQTRLEYLRRYNQIDVCLDTFPFNGITTTCDALRMGVPAVSLCGRTHVSRSGLSLLSAAGLGALAVPAPEDYVRAAVRLANDIPSLAALRRGLRERVSRSPLRDEAGFARRTEAAYRHMWRAWCGLNHASDG